MLSKEELQEIKCKNTPKNIVIADLLTHICELEAKLEGKDSEIMKVMRIASEKASHVDCLCQQIDKEIAVRSRVEADLSHVRRALSFLADECGEPSSSASGYDLRCPFHLMPRGE